eukprot:m.93300 g.93300  ORF g.93300 m.93300 type:complete len:70 (-) comp8536_c0_seq3:215-424(-)
MKDIVRTPEQGADTALWLAVCRAIAPADNGAFFQDRVPVNKHLLLAGTSRPESDQQSLMSQLSELAAKL